MNISPLARLRGTDDTSGVAGSAGRSSEGANGAARDGSADEPAAAAGRDAREVRTAGVWPFIFPPARVLFGRK